MKATENRRQGAGSPARWFALVLVLGAAIGAANIFGAFNTVADGSKHPAYGALCLQQAEGDPWACTMPAGGTLVAPNVLLANAHGAPFVAGAYKIGFTFDEIPGPSPVVYEVDQFIPDPAFMTMGLDDPHDLAVVLLKDEVEGVKPVLLPPVLGMLDHGHVALKTWFTLVDRGPTTLDGWNGDMTTLYLLPGWTERRYGEAVGTELRPGAIMIGPDARHPAQPCMGSGSLALLTNTNIAVGIGSMFHAGALCGSPFGFTRLDTRGTRDFLQQYLPASLLPR